MPTARELLEQADALMRRNRQMAERAVRGVRERWQRVGLSLAQTLMLGQQERKVAANQVGEEERFVAADLHADL